MLQTFTAALDAADPQLVRAGGWLLISTASLFAALGLTVGWLARR